MSAPGSAAAVALPRRWLFVTGLAFEAAIAARCAAPHAAGTLYGLRGARLAEALSARLAEPDGATLALVSFGVAGGLAPDLAPGTIVLADAVVGAEVDAERSAEPVAESRYPCDPDWRAALQALLPDAVVGPLVADDLPVLDGAAKRQRHRDTGALAVDMESHRVAQVAARHGLPFVVCRVIADPAWRAVPSAALAAMGENGDIAIGALLRALLRQPRQLAMLPALALDSAVARRALQRAARAFAHGVPGEDGRSPPGAGAAGTVGASAGASAGDG